VVSWIELFYSKSQKYRTLEGWLENQIEFEEELHSADPGAWSGKLRCFQSAALNTAIESM
jgi:hypothetical protein